MTGTTERVTGRNGIDVEQLMATTELQETSPVRDTLAQPVPVTTTLEVV